MKLSEDTEVSDSPFVYLMNKVKYEAMAREDYMCVPHNFSMFNRQTHYPFDPIPNVVKIAPLTEESL